MTPVIPVTIEGHQLRAELALTYSARVRGLRGRTDLPPDGALLMCHPYPGGMAIWMRDTLLPLSAAFLDARRLIINIVDLTPLDETFHLSVGPAQYALETHRGWFADRRIGRGSYAEFELPRGSEPS